eukprot:8527103-Alexandrium_andersonii.AAC.1
MFLVDQAGRVGADLLPGCTVARLRADRRRGIGGHRALKRPRGELLLALQLGGAEDVRQAAS